MNKHALVIFSYLIITSICSLFNSLDQKMGAEFTDEYLGGQRVHVHVSSMATKNPMVLTMMGYRSNNANLIGWNRVVMRLNFKKGDNVLFLR
jgi:hypothetical protein